jgi:hypothetical protein
MCLTSNGRHEGQKWMVEEELSMYVRALQDVSRALKKPSKTNSDSILITSRLFTLYEVGITTK